MSFLFTCLIFWGGCLGGLDENDFVILINIKKLYQCPKLWHESPLFVV